MYDPRFAFLALDGDKAVGHVMATWGGLDGTPALELGPLSVEPSRQGQGIGSQLMEATLDAPRQAGASVIVLLGEPGYYARFGFVPAADLGISADPAWGEFFRARPLADGWGRDGDAESQAHAGPRGVITYPEPFARLGWRPAHPSSRLSGANEGGRPMRRPASRVRERREAPEARQRVASATLRQGQVSSSLTVLNRTSTPSLTSVPAAGVCEQTFQCLSSSWGRLVPSASSECET
ncbi:N-acetyltransferase [Dermacoccus nishinomiyaensis]|nr:N-acetyltransferase [Dermacoccus nishinomiyaensis]